MANTLSVSLQVDGFEDPFFIEVGFEGYDDPMRALEEMGLFRKSLTMTGTIKGLESKPLVVRTEPAR